MARNATGRQVRSRSARVREQLKHPVIDCDGHWFEPLPVFLDFLRDAGGSGSVDAFRTQIQRGGLWYERTAEERYAWRQPRPAAWAEPGNTLDRATADLPGLLHDRLDEFGIDFAVIYPSLGLGAVRIPQSDLRRAWIRAANNMSAELFAPYQDRLTPVAIVPSESPDEAIEELEYVRTGLGLKAMFMDGNVRRPIGALTSRDAEAASTSWSMGVPYYIDPLGLDSTYDYDPLWAKAVELKVAVTMHGGGMGWPDRTSPSNFVYNHIGHFATAGHAAAKALLLGGVTRRFPQLNFAFLEGGVAWACQLYLDIIGHWRKRNAEAMHRNLCPTQVNMDQLRTLYEQHGSARLKGRFDEVLASFSPVQPFKAAAQLVGQEPTDGPMSYDDFIALGTIDEESLKGLFRDHFWFGCEADDPGTGWAFNKQLNLGLKPVFSSDIGHFDVPDMRQVLYEAYELLNMGLLDEADFERFTFSNAVSLHAGMNPDFFVGTAVQGALSVPAG
jgi:predicted TIM-barrel fold metal-dependent hydrolase